MLYCVTPLSFPIAIFVSTVDRLSVSRGTEDWFSRSAVGRRRRAHRGKPVKREIFYRTGDRRWATPATMTAAETERIGKSDWKRIAKNGLHIADEEI